jgi:hypothetical protein
MDKPLVYPDLRILRNSIHWYIKVVIFSALCIGRLYLQEKSLAIISIRVSHGVILHSEGLSQNDSVMQLNILDAGY